MSLRYLRMFGVLILAACPATLPAQQACSVFNVAGTWAVQGQGTLFPTLPGATVPIAVPGGDIGIAYIGYDGRITINITGISTRAGVSAQTLTGTIDVRSDCTAVVTAPTPIPGFTSKELFMILDHGNEMWTLALNGLNAKPAVWQCHWRKISPTPWPDSPSNCSAGLLHGTYAGQYNGVLVPTDASTPAPLGAVMMGEVTYQGQMDGTFTTSLSGNLSAGTYSGSITEVRPDCTGTWTFTFRGADGAQLPGGGLEKFVILDNGKEILTLSVQGGAGTPVGVGHWRQLSPAPYR
jgi:hypothetical protein